MRLLDPPDAPSGREEFTRRPAWRVRFDTDEVRWAFLERRGGRLIVVGYPGHDVEVVRPPAQPGANAVVGASAGALVGAALGGPAGAVVGGLIGAVLMASGSSGTGGSTR